MDAMQWNGSRKNREVDLKKEKMIEVVGFSDEDEV
jgi:hypothetical protein